MKYQHIEVREYGGPGVLSLVSGDIPVPGPGQLLVKLEAAGVNPVDGYRRSGTQGYQPPLPFCPGFEGAGVIQALGPGCNLEWMPGLGPGSRVYVARSLSGTYGNYCLASDDQVFPIPLGMDYVQAAVLYVAYFTAYRALVFRGGILPGDRVLVHGASGGVGLAALQWCSFFGNEVWGTAGTPAGLELLGGQGISGMMNHREPEYQQRLRDSSGGFDIILEMRADINLEGDLELLNDGGRILVVGSRGGVQITPRKTMSRESDIRGVLLLKGSTDSERIIHRSIEKAYASGDIEPVIRASYPLARASKAHEDLEKGESAGKLVLSCSGE